MNIIKFFILLGCFGQIDIQAMELRKEAMEELVRNAGEATQAREAERKKLVRRVYIDGEWVELIAAKDLEEYFKEDNARFQRKIDKQKAELEKEMSARLEQLKIELEQQRPTQLEKLEAEVAQRIKDMEKKMPVQTEMEGSLCKAFEADIAATQQRYRELFDNQEALSSKTSPMRTETYEQQLADLDTQCEQQLTEYTAEMDQHNREIARFIHTLNLLPFCRHEELVVN